MHAYQDLLNAFDWADKTQQPKCKSLRVWTNNEDSLVKFQENFEIFDQNLYKKLTFSQIFTKYFLDF